MANSNQIQVRAENILTLIETRKEQIQALLPPDADYNRMKWVVMNQLRRNPKLFNCTSASIINCVMQSAQTGLELDDMRGLAYMIPYGDTAQFIPGYKGFIDLAYRSGKVKDIWAAIVYENEKHTYREGIDRKLEHDPLPPDKRGEMIAVYAVAQMIDGAGAFAWLWKYDIEKIKKSAKKPKDKTKPWLWETHEEEMIKKTAIRRLAKTANISIEFSKSATLDERADLGLSTQEIFGDDEATEDIPGKPVVAPPEEIPDAEIKEPSPLGKAGFNSANKEEEDAYSQIIDLSITMEYNELQISSMDSMLKRDGVFKALDAMRGAYNVWLKQQLSGTTPDTTVGNGAAKK